MEDLAIKQEFNGKNQQCQTCLSVGRKLQRLGPHSHIYTKLISEYNQFDTQCLEELEICWECHAMLYKIVQFQQRAVKANEMLILGQSYIYGTLSNLTTIILNDNHSQTIFVNESTMQTDVTKSEPDVDTPDLADEFDDHQHLDDVLDDNNEQSKIGIQEFSMKCELKETKEDIEKVTTKNRWAKKRAIQNKKPKFKIISANDIKTEVFRRVQICSEEMYSYLKSERNSQYFKSKRFRCEKCVVGFSKEYLLRQHNQNCHEKAPYTCDICETQIFSKRRLLTHIKEHYYKYECTICPFTCYSQKKRHLHVQREHSKLFQCLKCGLRFGGRREFFKHFKEWHEKYICDYCGISFKMKYCIRDHIRKQHSPFECKQCDKRFARYNGLWLHNKTRHGAPSGAGAAYCVECDKRYADIYRYRWHLANSARHKPRKRVRVPCPSCDKIFSKKIYMKDHYNLVHLKCFKYRCEQCDKNFIRNADLVKHKRRVHEGILPPKNKICYMCGRGFSTNKILTNHVRTHTGERPFACAQCPSRFAQSTALTGHIRATHHSGKQGEKSGLNLGVNSSHGGTK